MKHLETGPGDHRHSSLHHPTSTRGTSWSPELGSDWDADWDACLPDDDKLLLQTGVRAWAATGVCDDVEGRQRSRRFVPGEQ